MIDGVLQEELLKKLDRLSPAMQRRVLDYASSLKESKATLRGTHGRELLQFAGILSPEEAKAMMDAIEEGCERIDPDEW
jgi:hypothetical protein